MGYLSLLQEEFSGPLTDSQRTDLTLAREASERLLALIDNLLDLTDLKRGGMTVHVETFDPREPLRDAVTTTRGRADATMLRVAETADPLPFMRSDRRKLAKILASLLSNAYKFTARGAVTVGLEIQHGRARYCVQDTGIGISAAAQQMIFEEFRQVDGSLTRRFGGTGLGLALARHLARSLGGDIDLVSTPGEGATFIVEIPLEYQSTEQPGAARRTSAG
jgi:signal transduction histidine kinase